jgi:hypothetical protein
MYWINNVVAEIRKGNCKRHSMAVPKKKIILEESRDLSMKNLTSSRYARVMQVRIVKAKKRNLLAVAL